MNCKHKCKKLYLKYVANGSKYEINISYQARQYVIDMIETNENFMMMSTSTGTGDENKNSDVSNANEINELLTLLLLFNQCGVEMYSLLQDSFKRFKNCNQYQKLNALVFLDKHQK